MESRLKIAAVLALCGAAAPALAQDSVSNLATPGLPGDAVSAYDPASQVERYVVDLAPLFSSWGNTYGIAPLMKASASNSANFFNAQFSAQGISANTRVGVSAPASAFQVWTTPGAGVGPNNSAPSTTTPAGQGVQFGAAFSEFDGSLNGIVGGTVFYSPAAPSRLFVTRTVAATNGLNNNENRAQYGFGAVDSHGNVAFRADDFGVNGPNAIFGNNLFRVGTAARNPAVVNFISDTGGVTDGNDAAATAVVLEGSADSHNTPSLIPQSVAGRPVLIGSNFLGDYLYEAAPETLAADGGAHRAGDDDHRGNVSFSALPVFPGAAGASAMLGYDTSGSFADSILIWGVNADGSVAPGTPRRITLPSTITDNDDAFDLNAAYGPGWFQEFGSFRSQVAFRGGNGAVAIGRDQAGRTLIAATVHIDVGYTPNDTVPVNAVVVGRITGDPTTGPIEWTLAAHNYRSALNPNGKAIKDGPAGSEIGRLIRGCELTQNPDGDGDPPCDLNNTQSFRGPSMSAPMIDSVGNVYFLATAELYDSQGGVRDQDPVLVRAVYNPAAFSYQLEELLELGWRFTGENSGTEYQIRALSIIDNNSVNSSSMFTGNINQSAAHGMSAAGLNPADPRTLGGLAFYARIVYDTNGDGFFDIDTVPGDTLPGDEAYAALMYVGSTAPVASCRADFDNSGTLTLADFVAFRNAYVAGDLRADFDNSGTLTLADFVAFRNAYVAGCP